MFDLTARHSNCRMFYSCFCKIGQDGTDGPRSPHHSNEVAEATPASAILLGVRLKSAVAFLFFQFPMLLLLICDPSKNARIHDTFEMYGVS